MGGIAGIAIALSACSALLDTDSLQKKKPNEAGTEVSVTEGGTGDSAGCTPGEACTVITAKGACRAGELRCSAEGVRSCLQTIQPGAETCDGKDTDCDGVADGSDPEAHAACGAGKYCSGNACVDGCTKPADCDNGNTCDTASKKCVCGDGPTCLTPGSCVSGTCKQPADLGVDLKVPPDQGRDLPDAAVEHDVGVKQDTATPDAAAPDAKPDAAKPDAKPDAAKPDAKPDAAKPDSVAAKDTSPEKAARGEQGSGLEAGTADGV